MSPDVRIVLVTYDRAEFLPRTLDCILEQTYKNFDVFICEDCSSDATPDICRRYEAQDKPRWAGKSGPPEVMKT